MRNQADGAEVLLDDPAPKTYLTVVEVARQLKVTRATTYGWVFRRILPHVKIGRFVRVDPVGLAEFLRLRRRGDFSSIPEDRTQTRPDGR